MSSKRVHLSSQFGLLVDKNIFLLLISGPNRKLHELWGANSSLILSAPSSGSTILGTPLEHTLSLFRSRFLVTAFNSGDSSAFALTLLPAGHCSVVKDSAA
jgi:hypothetical protein